LRGWFGWKSVLDLGDISAARATEAYLHLWLRLYGVAKSADFNVKLVR
jgi:8-hydroxy-5-deazaflavin:NADPH oxidoreductase